MQSYFHGKYDKVVRNNIFPPGNHEQVNRHLNWMRNKYRKFIAYTNCEQKIRQNAMGNSFAAIWRKICYTESESNLFDKQAIANCLTKTSNAKTSFTECETDHFNIFLH